MAAMAAVSSSVSPSKAPVLEVARDNDKFPKISRTTLWRALVDLGFTFVKRNRDSLLTERTDLVLWCATYLRAIRKHRLHDKTIYYLDETWVNAGHTRSKVWKDTTEAVKALLTVLQKFWAKKGSGDYHEEIDGARFEEWFTEKLLPNLRPNSVIDMENAPYHAVRLHTLPSSRTRKQAIQKWLTYNDVVWDPTFLKAELLDLVERARLTMPGANKTFKLAEVELLTPGALQQVTPDDWKAYPRHVIDVENKMWEADCFSDTVIDSVVIHLGSDDNKSSDEDMADSSDEDMGCEYLSW
ncbi:uncharacterized protein LOC120843204 [Ixodes scapularis]|uniref:uncharacterized protein LOC120843204 n=1 Tax=Ixodes scapularis TaxID=6945 RepID=UPI001A9E7564|nr:uncharacterized protein LOC120843204 [Ixodes scapularis]